MVVVERALSKGRKDAIENARKAGAVIPLEELMYRYSHDEQTTD